MSSNIAHIYKTKASWHAAAFLLSIALSLTAVASLSESAKASDAQLRSTFRQHSPTLVAAVKDFSRLFFAWNDADDTALLQLAAMNVEDKASAFKQAIRRVRPSSARGRRAKRLLLEALNEYWRTGVMFFDAVEPLYPPPNRGEATSRMNMATAQAVVAARMMKQARRAMP